VRRPWHIVDPGDVAQTASFPAFMHTPGAHNCVVTTPLHCFTAPFSQIDLIPGSLHDRMHCGTGVLSQPFVHASVRWNAVPSHV